MEELYEQTNELVERIKALIIKMAEIRESVGMDNSTFAKADNEYLELSNQLYDIIHPVIYEMYKNDKDVFRVRKEVRNFYMRVGL